MFFQELFENTWETLLMVLRKWVSPRLFKRNKEFLLIMHGIQFYITYKSCIL